MSAAERTIIEELRAERDEARESTHKWRKRAVTAEVARDTAWADNSRLREALTAIAEAPSSIRTDHEDGTSSWSILDVRDIARRALSPPTPGEA